jgi:hypothetical protein
MSWCKANLLVARYVTSLVMGMAAIAALGQYPGQVAKKSADMQELRSIAVLEWTGDEGKPTTCRLVPVSVYDGQLLQDGGIYMARPEPLALAGEVEYELEKNGKAVGLFDIKNTGQEQGTWVGYGAWKPMPEATPKAPPPVVDAVQNDDSDKPVLHRRKEGGSDSSAPAPSADPDRPTLHKKPGGDDSSQSGSGGSGSSPAPDPDRPTLHKTQSSTEPDNDPDRPTLQRKAKTSKSVDDLEPQSTYTDPDRPRLKRGKSTGSGLDVLPSLMGLPPDMKQEVAVSDAKNRPEHPWDYTWANPDDEGKMKAALEAIARDALGLKSAATPAPKRTGAHPAGTRTKSKTATPPPAPPPLSDEQFRVFELSYGSGATLVLTAHTDGPLAQEKFVTLVAQPDLYGNVALLLKSVADGAHLDENPRMRLVGAVDALADNRGELLFELRGATQRQFALYRILRGTAQKLFATGGNPYGAITGN